MEYGEKRQKVDKTLEQMWEDMIVDTIMWNNDLHNWKDPWLVITFLKTFFHVPVRCKSNVKIHEKVNNVWWITHFFPITIGCIHMQRQLHLITKGCTFLYSFIPMKIQFNEDDALFLELSLSTRSVLRLSNMYTCMPSVFKGCFKLETPYICASVSIIWMFWRKSVDFILFSCHNMIF
jgi:hypothetical protein